MGIVRRKYNKERVDLHTKYKRPILLVAQTMHLGFTDEEFCAEFKRLQPLLWNELQDKYLSYKELDIVRKSKGRILRNFPNPKRFLLLEAKQILKHIRDQHEQGNFNQHEIFHNKLILEERARKKTEQYRIRIFKDLYLVQEVNPSYVSKLINIYYSIRKINNLDVNSRLAILQEVAKYKSKDTISFLKKIQSGDKNENLRMAAYYALLKMHAPDVTLHRKRKGKKRMNQIVEPKEQKTPQELLQSIYNADFERIKEFDVFISHSSRNKETIHSIVKTLNDEGLVCYVDWIADRQQLQRQLTSKETAEVIVNRIKQSKFFLYIQSKECIASKWSPWELGYAYAINKPVCVYPIEKVEDKPQYLDLHTCYKEINDVVAFIKQNIV